MSQKSSSDLRRRVADAAEAALAAQKYVSPVDVLAGIGWLPQSLVDYWRRGRVDQLEGVGAVRADNLPVALDLLRQWAEAKQLEPSEISYVSATRDRRPLRFTAAGEPNVERLCRTHWSSPDLSEAKRDSMGQRQSRAPDLVVIYPLKEWRCAGCGGKDSFLFMENDEPHCLTCVDMDHLVYLPAGDAALSRRAKKASGLAAVVVRFSRSRKRYERQGILVEEAALEQAEEQCLADEDARERRRVRDVQRRENEDVELRTRTAREITRLFPGCPAVRSEAIAHHTATRGSGRVGRSAAGRALDDNAITAAVVASVRHEDTAYDRLLMSGVPRAEARDRVRPDIDRVLDGWRGV